MKAPRLIIAAPKSGSGKTVLTISLMSALTKMGLKVSSFKCGPDYIDPMYHNKVLDIDSCNLDLFFTDEETTRGLFLRNNTSDISIIEGVMGLYDGLGGISEEASTYHLAKTLKAPIILVLDAKGMSLSVVAEAAGFISMDEKKLIKGIILNNMSSGIFGSIKKLIEEKLKVPVLGYFSKQKECDISSRYLGLSLPDEIENLKDRINKTAEEFSRTVNINELIEIANNAEEVNSTFAFSEKQKITTRIAVARDEAFNFYYRDNLDLLENLGAELVFFSPIHDKKIPENIGGLLLGGGYPELCAKELSENKTMIESINIAVKTGLPVWAECGGFMYLHEGLETKDGNFKFCSIIKGKCIQTEKLVRFGYMTLSENKVKGHEFHYFDSDNNGNFCTAEKPTKHKQWKCCHNINGGLQGFPHLYYPSNIEYAKQILEVCRNYKGIQ